MYESLKPDAIAAAALIGSSVDPLKVFDESATRGTATVATAQLCLQKFTAQLDTLDASTGRAEIRSALPGKKVLHWLWEHGTARDAADFVNMNGVMYLLCFTLENEGDGD